jgi:nucleotide-binding universal stress UspA family protein
MSFQVKKILLPVDFSSRSCAAARYAIPFAERFHSQIIVLHVLPSHYEFGSVEMGGAVLGDLVAQRLDTASRNLGEFLSDELAPFAVQRLLREGDPATKIVEIAHEENCDLICMPTHGYGPFRRLLLGSVAAKVLHDADCPVWTGVHLDQPQPGSGGSLRKVLCAVDLEPNSAKVLGWANGIASEFGAAVTLIHALPSLQPMTEAYQLSPEWRKLATELAQADITRLQNEVGTKAEFVLGLGEVAGAICDEARRLEADLVVIGRGSKTGLLGRLTQHAYSIIRQSPCPAVSV